VPFGQSAQALLTTLYRSTDRLCRGGAAVKNLAQSASLHAGENNAPSKPGTKHLGFESTPIPNARVLQGRRIGVEIGGRERVGRDRELAFLKLRASRLGAIG
jgi:hypothetical protein